MAVIAAILSVVVAALGVQTARMRRSCVNCQQHDRKQDRAYPLRPCCQPNNHRNPLPRQDIAPADRSPLQVQPKWRLSTSPRRPSTCYHGLVSIICEAPIVIDGDTIACANLPVHVRIMGIDAPELPGHCRPGRQCTPGDGEAARDALVRLIAGYKVKLKPVAFDHYGRQLAYVKAGGQDVGCAMVAAGYAVYRYSKIRCG